MTLLILTVIVWWIIVQALKPPRPAEVRLPIENARMRRRDG